MMLQRRGFLWCVACHDKSTIGKQSTGHLGSSSVASGTGLVGVEHLRRGVGLVVAHGELQLARPLAAANGGREPGFRMADVGRPLGPGLAGEGVLGCHCTWEMRARAWSRERGTGGVREPDLRNWAGMQEGG